MPSKWVRAGAAGWFCLAATAPAMPPENGVCFGPRDRPTLPIYQTAPPPRADADSTYRYYPASAVLSMTLRSLTGVNSSVGQYYLMWANHGPRVRNKSNISPDFGNKRANVDVEFSSPALADECTLQQQAFGLGRPGAATRRSGASLSLQRELPNAPLVSDVCVMPVSELPPRVDMALDYEVSDDRSPAEASAFLARFAQAAHAAGRRAILVTNPLDSVTAQRSGLTNTVLREAIGNFDAVTVHLAGRNLHGSVAESFRSQAGLFGQSTGKMLITFELNTSTMADAITTRGILDRVHPAGVLLVRNLAQQGGACNTPVNRKISCVAFGRC